MREMGRWQADDGLDETFTDIEALAADCRFGNCAHDTEPGCAVKAAVRRGDISPARLASYHSLRQEQDGLAGLHRRFAEVEDRRTRQKLVHLFSGKLKRR